MANDEQQIATSIEMNQMQTEENKESNDNYKSVPLDNNNTVFGFAMNLKRAFDDDIEVYEPVNWKLTAYWIHLWIIYGFFNYTGDQFENNN